MMYRFIDEDRLAGLISLGGTLLAPVSGGLSAVAAAAAIGTSGYTMWSNHQSNKDLSEENKKALRKTKKAMKRYDSATKELLNILQIIVHFEEMEILTDVRDIVFMLSRITCEILNVNPYQNRAMLDTSTRSDNTPVSGGVIGSAGCLISNAMSSPAQITHFTRTTETVMQQTSLLTTFEHSSRSAKAAFTVGQTTIKVAGSAQKAPVTTRGTSELILSANKVMQTTSVSKTVKETSKVSVTATKAASISKVGVAMSVIAIPLDIYNIINLENTTPTTPEEVKRIRDAAKTVGTETLEKCIATIETFELMHMEIYQVYENHRVERLYEFLEMCHQRLNLNHPSRRLHI